MNRSSNKKFQVFEFDDKDNDVEQYNYKFHGGLGIRRTKMKRDNDSPISKYHFLQSFAGDTEIKDQGRSEPIYIDAEVVQETKKAQAEDSIEFLDSDASDRNLHCKPPVMYPNTTPSEDGPVKVGMSRMNSSIHKIQPIAAESSEIRNTESTPSATSTFCTPKNQVLRGKQLTELDCGGCEIDDKNMTVKIFPGFILYQDIPMVESCLTFSCNGIKLEASTSNSTRKTFCSEWTTRDVRKIKSDWNASVKNATVCLHLRSKNSKGSETEDSSGVEQLIFYVYDPDWYKRQEAIRALDERYREKWNIEDDMIRGEKEFLSGSSMFSSKKYNSSSDNPFQDVIYPKGDPDAVIIHKRDIELLEPERFINDTIIDFYIKYLAKKFQKKHRFHFFNSFFFRKLADLDKDRSSACKGKAAFQRVRKWTRKVNIFRKDYVFIPVNYSFHWSLLVICYPGEVPNFNDKESESVSKVPCILHMDSIRGSHKGLKTLIQSYLCEEWKERHNDTAEDASSKFLLMKFVPLELPQQENLYDCGLFLLHYVERFLEEVPLNFCPFNVTKSSNFLSRNWFLPEEASLKRYRIKKLMYKIFEDHSQNVPTADSIDLHPSLVPSEACDQETEVIVLEQISSSTKTHGISSSCNAEQVGESLAESRDELCIRKSVFLPPELSELGACTSSYTGENYLQSPAPRHGNTTSMIEEVDETDEIVAESPLNMEDCEEVAEFKLCQKHEIYSLLDSPTQADEQVPESPLVVEDSEEERSMKHYGVSVNLRKQDKRISVSEAPSPSPSMSSLGVDVAMWPQEIESFEKDKVACVVSNLDKELAGCFVKDSDDEDGKNDGNKLRCFRFTKRRRRKRPLSSKVPFRSR